ncbi:MAG: DUF542 domain-containing protein [Lutibacter sp.]|uniref:DUF542 domain-containing protein n=1 Tax=Lutibacter sp. TaxID=1925666 RepID=UPI00385AB710
MNITKEKSVAEVVTENMGADHVFSKYNIDFCCGGNVTLEKACKEKGIVFEELKAEIETVTNIINNDTNFNQMDVVSLMDYTQNVHHNYFSEKIPLILQLAFKVAEVHWSSHKEVVEINNLFNKVVPELNEQIVIEEKRLFPIIKKHIEQNNREPIKLEPLTKTILNIENVHKQIRDIFKNIAKLTTNYSPPKDACNTYKSLYINLQEFEQKLHSYFHFEKHILFPRVIES